MSGESETKVTPERVACFSLIIRFTLFGSSAIFSIMDQLLSCRFGSCPPSGPATPEDAGGAEVVPGVVVVFLFAAVAVLLEPNERMRASFFVKVKELRRCFFPEVLAEPRLEDPEVGDEEELVGLGSAVPFCLSCWAVIAWINFFCRFFSYAASSSCAGPSASSSSSRVCSCSTWSP